MCALASTHSYTTYSLRLLIVEFRKKAQTVCVTVVLLRGVSHTGGGGLAGGRTRAHVDSRHASELSSCGYGIGCIIHVDELFVHLSVRVLSERIYVAVCSFCDKLGV